MRGRVCGIDEEEQVVSGSFQRDGDSQEMNSLTHSIELLDHVALLYQLFLKRKKRKEGKRKRKKNKAITPESQCPQSTSYSPARQLRE